MAKRDKITAFMKDVINEIPASGKGKGRTFSDADLDMRSELVDPFFVSKKGEVGRSSSNAGRTISDADRKRIDALVGEIIGGTKKPKPRPDVGAIERGNRAAKRTAQDLATQNFEAGGAALVGGQKKLDKNKDGKISGADFRMMEEGGEAKVKKRKKSKGNMCRGGGAALRGTNFSGVK